MSPVHAAAREGFSNAADAYARGRPEYPAELADWLRLRLGVGQGSRVADLGAGTGKFTKLVVATGATVSAIEPVDAMRARLVEALPHVRAVAGTAEATTLAAASVDAVVCAQAFHWFATEAALAEIDRILAPGGRLGLVWNVRDETVDWVAEITRIIAPYEGDAPRLHSGAWRRPFAADQAAAGGARFTPLTETVFRHEHVGPAQQVIVDRFLSVSFIAALPADERERVGERLRALADEHPALHGQARISFPYRTLAYDCTRRRDAAG